MLGSSRPVNGSMPSATPNSRMKKIAHRNSGIDITHVRAEVGRRLAALPRSGEQQKAAAEPEDGGDRQRATASSIVAGSVAR